MDPEILARAERLLSTDPTIGRYRLAPLLGVGVKKARNILLALRKSGRIKPPATATTEKEHLTFEESGTSAVASSLSRDIRTLNDLLNYAGVDRTVWEVERYVVNKWDMGYKDKAAEAHSHPLFQVKAWLRRMVTVERTRGLIMDMLGEFRKQAPAQPRIHSKPPRDGCLLEISIFDLHLGKLCWAPEVGQHYDAKIAQSGFTEAVEALLDRAKGFPVSRILLPTGNDFFNVDNQNETTASGTPQTEDGRWQKTFAMGRKLMVDAIERLRSVAPVDVLMVPGNHDTERLFYLGEVLDGWFSKTPDVQVNNSPTMRKYYRFGNNLLGFTHGKEEKHSNLPLIMATEAGKDWAETKFREVHIGHWHHRKELYFNASEEFNGIRVRIIPSLCPADDWHTLKGFSGLRSAEAYVWSPTDGCVGNFSYNP